MTHPAEDALLAAIDDREGDIVYLARALIRIPSVNPPGEHYRDCAELIGERLKLRRFAVEYMRAEGVPGDSDRYPRWNVIARREGGSAGPCVHFNGHIDVVAPGEGWSRPRFDHVIIPEPLNVDRVCIGHRGVWWGEIETKGRIAHGSMPFLGDSAIRHMAAVLEAFETELYPALEAQATAMPVEPPGARTPTLNINSLHGGQPDIERGESAGLPAPLVADACRLVFDRRLLIEED